MDGDVVGSPVVGEVVGPIVGSDVVGETDGDVVGSELAGDVVGSVVPVSADVQRLPRCTAATSFVPSALEATEIQSLVPPAVVTSDQVAPESVDVQRLP